MFITVTRFAPCFFTLYSSRSARILLRSHAVIIARPPVSAAICVVLPPGAAAISRIFSSGCAPSTSGGIIDERLCI